MANRKKLTKDRIQTFLSELVATGSVSRAASATGMPRNEAS